MHADHVSGARALANATGAELHLHPLDGYRYHEFTPLEDGTVVGIGGVQITARHTPGHTRGSTSFLLDGNRLLTGDMLFVEGVARPDLHARAEEFAEELYATYHERLRRLPGDTVVLPAHFSQTVPMEYGKPFSATLSELRQRILLLSAAKTTFVQHVLSHIPPKPPNHEAILRINRGEVPLDPDVVDDLEEGPNRCALKA
jgi:glyoxylase-like metal-dependent hydrolase (beta-lactamase superfamily II)